MGSEHHHHGRATAAQPTMSLLRLSAGQRLAGAAVIVGVLWLLVAVTL